MSQILNNSLGGFFGTPQSPTTTTTEFYQNMVDSHENVVSTAIEKQAENAQAEDWNDTLKEIALFG